MPSPTRYGSNTRRKRSSSSNQFRSAGMSGLKGAAKAADKVGSGFIRWMVTDHAHTSTWLMLIEKPYNRGFWPWVWYILKCLFIPIGIAIGRVLLIILLYALLIPCVVWLFIFVLTH